MNATKLYKFDIWYFKPSGKFAYEAKVEWLATECEGGSAYMYDATAKLREMLLSATEPLPGLSSKTWDGPILVNCEEGFPCLLLPPYFKG